MHRPIITQRGNLSAAGSETTTSNRVVGVRSSLQKQGICEVAANIAHHGEKVQRNPTHPFGVDGVNGVKSGVQILFQLL